MEPPNMSMVVGDEEKDSRICGNRAATALAHRHNNGADSAAITAHMAEDDAEEDEEQDEDEDDDDSFPGELEPRGRCYTWPVPQFGAVSAAQQSPLSSLHPPPPNHHHLHHHHLFSGAPNSATTSATSSKFPSLSSIIGCGGAGTACSSSSCSLLTGVEQQQPCTSSSHHSPFSALSIDGQQQRHQHHSQAVQQSLLMSSSGGPCGVTASSSFSTAQLGTSSMALIRPKPKRVRRRTADGGTAATGVTDDGGVGSGGQAAQQHSHKKPNPWGEESYSDLIARALGCAIDGRLKLSEIYQWFSDNIPYFAHRSSQEEAQGWKNSIRHNLSLHNRFMRIQNEGAGKSSWWVINPDAKPGRNPRRRANTMEAATKAVIDKKRRGARKRVETLVQQKGSNGGCSASMASILGAQSAAMFPSGNDELNEQPQQQQQQQHMVLNAAAPTGGPNFDTFRPRAESTLSVVGGPASCSRLSPPNESSMEFPLWMDQLQQQQQQQQNGADTAAAVPSCSAVVLPTTTATTTTGAATAPPPVMNPQVSELLDRTDQMRLEATTTAVEQCSSNGRMMSSCNGGLLKMEMGCSTAPSSTASCSSTTSSVLLMPKCEIGAGGDPSLSLVKQEHSPTSSIGNNNCSLSGAMQTPPPSYQELNAVRRPAQLQTNPLLRQLGAGGMRNAGGGTPSPPNMKMGPNTSSMLTAVPSCSSSSSPNNNMFSTSASVVQQQSSSSAPFGTPFQQSSMASAGWLPPGATVGCGGPPQQQQTMPMMMMHQQQQNGIMVNGNGTVVGIGHLQQQQQYHQFIAANPGMVGATSLPQDLENVNAMPFDQSLLDLNDYEIAPDGQFDFP
ncbi:hypothetical protein niasHS_014213 [Heterodera schachtii]|uniref:Forkhead box protein O n=1 Tax=Heterodera schachtii TaxID=97005 RepID=A0ABD2IF19_HETSC